MSISRDFEIETRIIANRFGIPVRLTESMTAITDPDILSGADRREITSWVDKVGTVNIYSRDFRNAREADIEASVLYALVASRGPEAVLGEDGLEILGEALATERALPMKDVDSIREYARKAVSRYPDEGVKEKVAHVLARKFRLEIPETKVAFLVAGATQRYEVGERKEAVRNNDYVTLNGMLEKSLGTPAASDKEAVEMGRLSDVYLDMDFPPVRLLANRKALQDIARDENLELTALVSGVQKPLAILGNLNRGLTVVTDIRTKDGFLSFNIPTPSESRKLSVDKGFDTLFLSKPFVLGEGNLMGRCAVSTEAGPCVRYARPMGDSRVDFELTRVLTQLAGKAELGRLYKKGETGTLQIITHADAVRSLKLWSNIAINFRNAMGKEKISEVFEKMTGKKYVEGPAALELYEIIDGVTESRPVPKKKYSELLATPLRRAFFTEKQLDKLKKAGIHTASSVIEQRFEGIAKIAGNVGARNAGKFLDSLGLDYELPLMKRPTLKTRELPAEKRRGLVNGVILESLMRIPKHIDRGLYNVPVGVDGMPFRGLEGVELTAKMMTSPRMMGCNVFLTEAEAENMGLSIRVNGDPGYLLDGTPVYNLAETNIDRTQLGKVIEKYNGFGDMEVPAYVSVIFPNVKTSNRGADMGGIYTMIAKRYDEGLSEIVPAPSLERVSKDLHIELSPITETVKVKSAVPLGTLIQRALKDKTLDSVGSFHDGFALVSKDGKYNYIDKDGNFLTTGRWFDVATEFRNGHATVIRDNRSMEIDVTGAVTRLLGASNSMKH